LIKYRRNNVDQKNRTLSTGSGELHKFSTVRKGLTAQGNQVLNTIAHQSPKKGNKNISGRSAMIHIHLFQLLSVYKEAVSSYTDITSGQIHS